MQINSPSSGIAHGSSLPALAQTGKEVDVAARLASITGEAKVLSGLPGHQRLVAEDDWALMQTRCGKLKDEINESMGPGSARDAALAKVDDYLKENKEVQEKRISDLRDATPVMLRNRSPIPPYRKV
ncbi:hypothetical protein [Ottowia thiooxydans]|uniref:hypothetical protein n=1 Tax=Ottowia thiooxydans TaxID=219182 RepID=UPI0004194DBD|nr:hypothetical protein [Ottowia thiooxydans]